jgi:hypothetical protein
LLLVGNLFVPWVSGQRGEWLQQERNLNDTGALPAV